MGAKKKEKDEIAGDVNEKPSLATLLGNIHQRVNKVMGEINYIKKDKSIDFGKGGGFSVTGHDAVTKLIHPYLFRYGINIIPTMEKIEQSGNRSRVHMSFKWVNVDDPDDCFTTQAQADGVCNQDKGIAKAWSIAQRYTVLKTFHLETGEKDIEEYNIDATDLVENFAKEVEAKISKDEAKELIKFSSGLGLEQDDVVESLHEWGWERTTDVPVDSLKKFKDSLELKSLKKQPQAVAN